MKNTDWSHSQFPSQEMCTSGQGGHQDLTPEAGEMATTCPQQKKKSKQQFMNRTFQHLIRKLPTHIGRYFVSSGPTTEVGHFFVGDRSTSGRTTYSATVLIRTTALSFSLPVRYYITIITLHYFGPSSWKWPYNEKVRCRDTCWTGRHHYINLSDSPLAIPLHSPGRKRE